MIDNHKYYKDNNKTNRITNNKYDHFLFLPQIDDDILSSVTPNQKKRRQIQFARRNKKPRIKCYKCIKASSSCSSNANFEIIPKEMYKKNPQRSIIFEQES